MLTFQDLYESYASDVYRFAYWLVGDSAEAEDITSETFIRAWVHRHKFRTATLKAYLFAIARNTYLEQLRKANRHVTLTDSYSDPAPGPERAVESRLELQRIRQVLQCLPEIDRTAFLLRVHHDLPYAEIARVLGLSLISSRVKVFRVRKKLHGAFATLREP